MYSIIFMMLAMIMGLFAGTSYAGEENIMAMRGNPPDDAKPVNTVNMFIPARTGGVGSIQTHIPATLAASGVEEPSGMNGVGRKAAPESYLRWKDSCHAAPRLVAGQALEVRHPGGFGFTPRFVEHAEDDSPGFFKVLLKELTSG